MDSRRASIEREALCQRFPANQYVYCCAHGAIWDRRDARPNAVEVLG